MASFRDAVEVGLSPIDFWQMTPYLTGNTLPAINNHHIKNAWIAARLSRTKKMPTLQSLQTRRKVEIGDRMMELKAALAAKVK